MTARAGIDSLPRIDEHTLEVAADRERVWRALLEDLGGGSSSGRAGAAGAALLGCRERGHSGDLERPGATLVGFRVVRAQRPLELSLAGEHRFSSYPLTFRIDELDRERSLLRAATHAAFPGPHGRAYRLLVIDSGAHRGVVRAMLARIRRRALRTGG